jgi:class 3 adenylate cyclase
LATQDEKIAAASNATADETEREEAYRPLAVKRSLFARLNRPVIDFVARLPLRLEIKLLFVFLGAVGLLVLLGITGLGILTRTSHRTEELIAAERRTDDYHQLEHDGHLLMISVAEALWMPAPMVRQAKEQMQHYRDTRDGLKALSSQEAVQLAQLRSDSESFFGTVDRFITLINANNTDQAGAFLIDAVHPAGVKLDQTSDALIARADADQAEQVVAERATFGAVRAQLIAFVIGAGLFGVYLAHTISNAVVGPLREIGGRLRQIAEGEFGRKVAVPNRDELGELAENVNRTSEQLGELYTELEMEKERSEEMLYHTLPRPIVQRIRGGESLIADRVPEATILFSDLAGFTQLSEHLDPQEVLDVLDVLFSRYDAIAERLGLEKIKTIGDGYMVAGGVLEARADHAAAVAEMALAMRAATDIATRALGAIGQPLRVRIGIHSGPLVAGVIGSVKMVYDVWGDTVNTASRMEKYGMPGRIHVSTATRNLLGGQFRFEAREPIEIKGKGTMETFFLERRIGPRHFHNMMRQRAAAAPTQANA